MLRISGKIQTLGSLKICKKCWRIKRGDGDPADNDISYYQEAVPSTFGTDLRQCRNRVAHVDPKRGGMDGALTLPDFYEKYHKFVTALYEEPYWLWHMKAEQYDWGEIEAFHATVSGKVSQSTEQSLLSKLGNHLMYKEVLQALSERRRDVS